MECCPKHLRVRVDNWSGIEVTTVDPDNIASTKILHDVFLDKPLEGQELNEEMLEAANDPDFIVLALHMKRVLKLHNLETKGSIVGPLFDNVVANCKEEAYLGINHGERESNEDQYDSS